MNIKKRIYDYTLQPIRRPWLCLGLILVASILVFAVLTLLSWRDLLFSPWNENWQFLIFMSPALVLGLILDKTNHIKFPFLIQQYLIAPKLRQDLKELALRSSDGVILNYRHRKNCFGLRQETEFQIRIHSEQVPIWFKADLKQLFNTEKFIDFQIQPSEQLIGQSVMLYYLARSRRIVQIYALSDLNDFEEMKFSLPSPYTGKVKIDRIPTRLLLDLIYIRRIQAIREKNVEPYHLYLYTSYGHHYKVQSNAKHFKHLELALANLIEFLPYRKFKHDPSILNMNISKPNPFFYKNLVLILFMLAVISYTIFSQKLWLILLCILAISLVWHDLRRFRHSPFIEEGELK